ncbi:ATP-dependent nuclease [Methyloceanibacter marginalis]|uniref:ATP-dependent nuclease n=1 Tax=Methyloceanibacter marginalis TaxID=1774971 RepID=UPI001FCDC048|nr:AAA family ATPase [Methyloceanibacter marginalis]
MLTFNPNLLSDQIEGSRRTRHSQHNFSPEYRVEIITRIQAYFLARGSVREDRLPGNPSELEQFLAALLPDFTLTIDGNSNPPYKLVRTSTGQPVGDVHQLSSGEAQILSIALDVLTIAAMWEIQGAEKRLMLVDEPDAHIHPDLQVRFADFLVKVATRFDLQIAIATHSTTLLAALGQFGGEEASVVYLDRTTSEFRARHFSKEAKELAACLGGHALMGPLFGVPLLLVEGDDDYRLWSQVPRHHVVSFSVIPTNGDEIKRYQKSLETILAALREPGSPAGYALLDGDKPIPEANPDSPQEHIRFVRLSCHESENLYLTDEVLAALGTDWAVASAEIAAKANDYGEKGAALAEAPNWDRMKVDIHNLMNEITRILDAKNVHWTIRVARAIGEKRPMGQLLDFLGTDVVNALWGAEPKMAEEENPAVN